MAAVRLPPFRWPVVGNGSRRGVEQDRRVAFREGHRARQVDEVGRRVEEPKSSVGWCRCRAGGRLERRSAAEAAWPMTQRRCRRCPRQVGVRIRRLGRRDRGKLQAGESADPGEIAGVDAHAVVARRQSGERVVAAAVGQDPGHERRGGTVGHVVVVGVDEQRQRDPADARLGPVLDAVGGTAAAGAVVVPHRAAEDQRVERGDGQVVGAATAGSSVNLSKPTTLAPRDRALVHGLSMSWLLCGSTVPA
jgi:hypothetical protein